MAKQPNILFIMSDQQQYATAGPAAAWLVAQLGAAGAGGHLVPSRVHGDDALRTGARLHCHGGLPPRAPRAQQLPRALRREP